MSATLAIAFPGQSPLSNCRPTPASGLLPSHMSCRSCGIDHAIWGLEITGNGYCCTPCVAQRDAEVQFEQAMRWRALTGPALLLGWCTVVSALLVWSVVIGLDWVVAPSPFVVVGLVALGVSGFIVTTVGIRSSGRSRRFSQGPIFASRGVTRANQLSDALIVVTGQEATGFAAAACIVSAVL